MINIYYDEATCMFNDHINRNTVLLKNPKKILDAAVLLTGDSLIILYH